MTTTPRTKLPVGAYGPTWRSGIVIDHLHLVPADRLRHLPSGTPVVVGDDGYAIPVLCGELVPIWTEDGRIDGRCGVRVKGDAPACPAHAELIADWHAQSEAETMAWERSQ